MSAVCPKARQLTSRRIGRLQMSETGHRQKKIEAILRKLLMKSLMSDIFQTFCSLTNDRAGDRMNAPLQLTSNVLPGAFVESQLCKESLHGFPCPPTGKMACLCGEGVGVSMCASYSEHSNGQLLHSLDGSCQSQSCFLATTKVFQLLSPSLRVFWFLSVLCFFFTLGSMSSVPDPEEVCLMTTDHDHKPPLNGDKGGKSGV